LRETGSTVVRPHPVTSRDGAVLAGVSVATASKALIGHATVWPGTRRRVDGLIVVGSNTGPRASLGRDLPVPVVYAYAPSTDEHDSSVVPDNINAGTLAVQHLVATGRRRIGHVSGDVRYAAARDRAAGALSALEAAGLDLAGGQVQFGSWTEA
jgi:LacI family transcriptional regulator